MKMKKQFKLLMILVILLLLMVGAGAIYFFVIKEKPKEEVPQKEVIVTNAIEEYGYTLEDRDREEFKTKFESLKELLNTENFDQETYMKLISELFIMDLYTLDNKISRYDVGGLEYVYDDAKESFRSVAEESIYKTVENNLDDTRTQVLPIVISAEASNISETTFEMPDQSVVNGYRVELSWEYEEDLGYDSNGVIILIPDGKKMGVVFYKAK